MTDKNFMVYLDRPRRFRLTIEIAARAEEETGLALNEISGAPARDHDWETSLARTLWVFGLAEDPELTQLEAQKIIRKYIMNATPYLRLKRTMDMQGVVLRAIKEFQGELGNLRKKENELER